MRTYNLKSKIANAVLSLSLLFGIGIAATTTADAQWRDNTYRRQQREYEREQRRRQREYEREQRRAQRRAERGIYDNGVYSNGGYGVYNRRRTRDGYGNYGGTFDLRQTALNAGYNEGMKEGREDRSRGERFNFTDESDYRSATKDYSSRLGDRSTYQTYFRQAFQNGYRDGYNGVSGNGGYYDPYNY